MKKITIGIVAHVDSGKTTLSEAMLYLSGGIRKLGRVDKGDSFLDTDTMERKRGITIFSKQARFSFGETEFTLIDTPGHADFSAETERALRVLDYAVLLISAEDGIKGQTKILWQLLSSYQIPVFLFFNKMDRPGADREALFAAVRDLTQDAAVDLSVPFDEQAALCSEEAMEEFLETDSVSDETIRTLTAQRKLFPCLFGSALRTDGVEDLLRALDRFTQPRDYPAEFSASVYKIMRDTDGAKLTLVKITGGSLKTKTALPDGEKESKINQIRFYSGEKYTQADEAFAGDVCVLTGLKESFAGQSFGAGETSSKTILSPVLNYRVIAEEPSDPVKLLPVFKTLEEESPELSVSWDEDKKDIYVSLMGLMQLEVLSSVLKERFQISVSFDTGNVLYKETIAAPAIGVGHFEPLRHYAEVHLLLEPLERGAGLVFESNVSSDRLSKNWQRLILTHLKERQHRGVLTGSPITDMKITLVAGKAHLKHTEGGDFRQATYRAVRQGLMMTESILLEPFYRFSLEVPQANIGKALLDLDQMQAEFTAPEFQEGSELQVINGRGPVSSLKDYPAELASYTKGQGSLRLIPDGYGLCHNAEEVIAEKAYDPQSDLRNTADSVFCFHGAGHIIPYDEVYAYMHLAFDGTDARAPEEILSSKEAAAAARTASKAALGTDEVDAIIRGISSSGSRSSKKRKKSFGEETPSGNAKNTGARKVRISGLSGKPSVFPLEEADLTLVDGYNVIFAWEELSALAKENIDSARDALIDTLSKYASMVHGDVIAVFDAYKVKGRAGENTRQQDIQIVYTAEEQTADQYIERFANENAGKKRIAVITSDGVEQVVASAQGCMLLSSREFKARFDALSRKINDTYGIQ